MNNEELIKEFIKVEKTKSSIQISVTIITWKDPHTPEINCLNEIKLNKIMCRN